jgi:hypothetical protein
MYIDFKKKQKKEKQKKKNKNKRWLISHFLFLLECIGLV